MGRINFLANWFYFKISTGLSLLTRYPKSGSDFQQAFLEALNEFARQGKESISWFK
jgi:hypothetical protein